MKKTFKSLLFAAVALTGSATLQADSVVAVYTCEFKEGNDTEAVQAINARWLKWVRENVSEDIESAVGTAIVGQQNMFLFADTYPDLKTWAAAQEALDSDAASELEDLFDETSECTENRLWKFEPTETD